MDSVYKEVAVSVKGHAKRRSGHRVKRDKYAINQCPWELPVHNDKPIAAVSEQAIWDIHETAMRVLEEIGIDFLHEGAKSLLKKAGCDIKSGTDRVRMDRGFVMEQIKKAPQHFKIIPRNPQRTLEVAPDKLLFGQVGSPPNYSNLDEGRKVGNYKAYLDFIKLSQSFNCIHFVSGYPVEPIDIHASIRHLDAIRDKLIYTDKAIHAYSLGVERIEDAMEMVRIAGGFTHEEFEAMPRLFTNINSTSPLKHDWPMLDGAMRMARRNQPVIITPFTLSGAMAPITLVGALAQQTAEALAGIVLLQCVRPGTPVVYGAYTSNVDMKTGAPTFGTPEFMRSMQISGQLARFYGLPWRGSNNNAANFPDAQATWESVFSLWGIVTGGCNMVYHGAGWMEGGLTASYEKFIIDCEMLQQVMHYMKPVGVSEDDLAFEAMNEVQTGGHFFGCEHTQRHYKTAYYSPFLSDWSTYQNWEKNGSLQTHERANKIWKQMLAEFEAPPMDEGIRQELCEFVERRKREGGAPTDF